MKKLMAKLCLLATVVSAGAMAGCDLQLPELNLPNLPFLPQASESVADSETNSIVDSITDSATDSATDSTTDSSTDSTCEHKGGNATCESAAICEECGESYGEALGHEEGDWVEVTKATCTTVGEKVKTCIHEGCDKVLASEEIAMLDHDYVEGKCACGAEDPNYVPPHTHEYEAVVTAATCTTDGYTTYTCACGDTYTADEVTAVGHSYTEAATEPTCTTDGYTTYTCACGDSYTDDIVYAKHSYDAEGVCSVCNGVIVTMAPEVGKGYIFGMYQGNVKKVYYLKGGMNGYYMDTTTNPAEALYVYIEETEGGYYFYCYVNGTKTYINMVVSGTHVNGAYEASATTVYTIDETSKTLIANVNNADYWFATRNDKTYTTMGPCAVSYKGFYGEFYDAHIHTFANETVVAPTCTEAGYTSLTCACGAEQKTNEVAALNHVEGEWVETKAATCTEAGEQVKKCTREGCGATVATEEIPSLGHTFENGECACGAADPNYEAHVHSYEEVVTAATCTAGGYTTYTCACGDTYKGAEVEKLGHVDADLDIECDREGCTSKVAPAADSKLSIPTANALGSKLSTSVSYYVEGKIVEVLDGKNGVFLLGDDTTTETFYFRLPKNAEGVSHASWTEKLILGDVVSVYGKVNKFSTASAPNGSYYPAIQGGTVTILEQHPHVYGDPTCTEAGYCVCGKEGVPALGHSDENEDGLCDRCDWDMNLNLSELALRTDNNSGVVDTTAQTYTWENGEMVVVVAKAGGGNLYTTSKDHMRIYKNNTFTISSKNGIVMKTVTLTLTNATQVTNFEKILTGKTYTKDETNFTITIEWNSADVLELPNTGTSTLQIKGVTITY